MFEEQFLTPEYILADIETQNYDEDQGIRENQKTNQIYTYIY